MKKLKRSIYERTHIHKEEHFIVQRSYEKK